MRAGQVVAWALGGAGTVGVASLLIWGLTWEAPTTAPPVSAPYPTSSTMIPQPLTDAEPSANTSSESNWPINADGVDLSKSSPQTSDPDDQVAPNDPQIQAASLAVAWDSSTPEAQQRICSMQSLDPELATDLLMAGLDPDLFERPRVAAFMSAICR